LFETFAKHLNYGCIRVVQAVEVDFLVENFK